MTLLITNAHFLQVFDSITFCDLYCHS